MFCSNCGNQVAENSAFCAHCGNAINAQSAPVAEPAAAEPVVAAAASTPVAAPVIAAAQHTFNATPVQSVDAGSLMVKGILAIALCELGIPGIILGSMAKKLAAQFMAQNGGMIFGKAKVGSILGRLGFGFGLGFTILWGIYLTIFLFALGS